MTRTCTCVSSIVGSIGHWTLQVVVHDGDDDDDDADEGDDNDKAVDDDDNDADNEQDRHVAADKGKPVKLCKHFAFILLTRLLTANDIV